MSFFKRKIKTCLYVAIFLISALCTLSAPPVYAESRTELIDSSGTDIATITIDKKYVSDDPMRLEVIYQSKEPTLIISAEDGSVWSKKRQEQSLTGSLAVKKSDSLEMPGGKYHMTVYHITTNEQNVDISPSSLSGQTIFFFLTEKSEDTSSLLPAKKILAISSPDITEDSARTLLTEVGAQDIALTEGSEELEDEQETVENEDNSEDTVEDAEIPKDVYEKAKKAAQKDWNKESGDTETDNKEAETKLQSGAIFYQFIERLGGIKKVKIFTIALIIVTVVLIMITVIRLKYDKTLRKKQKKHIQKIKKKPGDNDNQEKDTLCFDVISDYFNEAAYDIGYIKEESVAAEDKQEEYKEKNKLNVTDLSNSTKDTDMPVFTVNDKEPGISENNEGPQDISIKEEIRSNKDTMNGSSVIHSAPAWIIKPGEMPAWAKAKAENEAVFF